jgi:sugar phosphate isomerase/epimerase
VADATLAQGLRLVYHHHMGTIVESASDIQNLMAATGPSVHLLLDTVTRLLPAPIGGACAALPRPDLPPPRQGRAARRHGARAARKLSFLDAVIAGVFTVPGDGCVDFPAVMRALPGYAGWAVVEAEQDPEKAHPLTTRAWATLTCAAPSPMPVCCEQEIAA